MQKLSIFLLMALTAAAAVAQIEATDPAKTSVVCPDDECHVAPVFMGEGGFVGSLADGFDQVNFVAECGNVIVQGSAMGDSAGIVRAAFTEDNGLACGMDGSIQIHGLADGGWYWINSDTNSAVSPLIAKDALMGDEVMPTDPGGVSLSAGDYGSLVTHAASGRIGILPHFVPSAPVEIPEPEMARVCMPEWNARTRAYYANDTDCMLGDGGTVIKMTRVTSDGRSAAVAGAVERNPGGGSDVEVILELWGNGSGHISGSSNPHLGWDHTPSRVVNPEPFLVTYVASPNRDGTLGTGLEEMGVTLERGGMMNVPGDPVMVEATADDAATKAREDGFYMDSTTGEAQCKQNVRTVTDGIGGEVMYLQFAARSGDDPVELNVATAGPTAGASLSDLAEWVGTHNGVAANQKIDTVTVRHGGADDTIGDDPDTGTNEAADDGDHELPAVVCETMPGESTTRYVDAKLVISPETTYCNDDNQRTAHVYILAYSAQGMNDVTPAIEQATGPASWQVGLNGVTSLSVHCPRE